jgi:hypothetical protein
LPVTPIPDPVTGAPTCPQGYLYDPLSGLCQPILTNTGATQISVTPDGLVSNEVDPVQKGLNTAVGWGRSGFIGQFVSALWHALWLAVDDGVGIYFNIFNRVIATIADQVSGAVTRANPGLWIAIGSLLSDLLGINLDGGQLYQQLATRGTLPAMQAVGGSLIDLLIGEFTGTATGQGGTIQYSSNPDPATGLPPATLSPTQGLLGAKALMGFVLTSAIRQANVDGLVDAIPFGLGAAFEKYSEGVRTNLGIGRMMRFALKPIFKVLIADQVSRGMNETYTPALLSAEEAFSAFDQGIFTQEQLEQELAWHGYSTARWGALEWKGRSTPSRDELRGLHIAGVLDDPTYYTWMRRTGYVDTVTQLLDQWEDIKPARTAVLKEAGVLAAKFITGAMPFSQFNSAVSALAISVDGFQLLSFNEASYLKRLPSALTPGAKLLHLPFATLTTMYEDGVITLQGFQAELSARGYSADQQQELTLLLLIKAKAAQEKAALAAAKAAVAAGTASAAGETAVATAETNIATGSQTPGVTL